MQAPYFRSQFRPETARLIAPPDALNANSGAALVPPTTEDHSYSFATVPFDGSMIVKSKRAIHYFDKRGTVNPGLQITSTSEDVYFCGMNMERGNTVRLVYGIMNPTTKELVINEKLLLPDNTTVVRQIIRVYLPAIYKYDPLSTHIMFSSLPTAKAGTSVSFEVIVNKKADGTDISHSIQVKYTRNAGVQIVDTDLADGIYPWLHVSYRTTFQNSPVSQNYSTTYAAGVRRSSEASSGGIVSILSGGNYLDIMYNEGYLPVPTLNASLDPYMLLVPINSDIVVMSSSISSDGTKRGGSVPQQRVFSRPSFDNWLAAVAANGGSLYTREWVGQFPEIDQASLVNRNKVKRG
jgi:hypothetical protein